MKPIVHSLCGEAGVSQVDKDGHAAVHHWWFLILMHMYADNGLQLVWYTMDVQYEVGLLHCWSWQIFSSIDGWHYETTASATQHESVSCQHVAIFIKLDFACPVKVAVFVRFLNNSSFDAVITG